MTDCRPPALCNVWKPNLHARRRDNTLTCRMGKLHACSPRAIYLFALFVTGPSIPARPACLRAVCGRALVRSSTLPKTNSFDVGGDTGDDADGNGALAARQQEEDERRCEL